MMTTTTKEIKQKKDNEN